MDGRSPIILCRHILTLLMQIRRAYSDKYWKITNVNKCKKIQKERKWFGIFSSILEKCSNQNSILSFLYISILRGVTRKIKNKPQNLSQQWKLINYSKLLRKVSGPWDLKQKRFIIWSETIWPYLAFFYYFSILGWYKKVKKKL